MKRSFESYPNVDSKCYSCYSIWNFCCCWSWSLNRGFWRMGGGYQIPLRNSQIPFPFLIFNIFSQSQCGLNTIFPGQNLPIPIPILPLQDPLLRYLKNYFYAYMGFLWFLYSYIWHQDMYKVSYLTKFMSWFFFIWPKGKPIKITITKLCFAADLLVEVC